MLEVKEISKSFGSIKAVSHVSFTAEKGQILGFLGPNGAGKSTTMRMVTGFLPPSSGTAIIDGHDIREDAVAAKKRLGYLPENAPFYGEMTASSFLRFIAELRGYRGSELVRVVGDAIERCQLEKVRKQTIGTMSKGYKQRVCFAQAVLHDPQVLIMDEPTDGLDPNQKHVVRSMIRQMATEKTIVISTHILEEVDAICTDTIVINNGRLVARGTPDELRAKSAVHGAVELTLADDNDSVRAALETLSSCARVEFARKVYTVYPKEGAELFTQVTGLVAEKGWRPTSMRLLDGRLDDVFKSLTVGDDLSKVN